MNIKIYKDGSLKNAYGCFAVLALSAMPVLYLFDQKEYSGMPYLAAMMGAAALFQADPRALLTINEVGIRKRGWLFGSRFVPWEEIEELRFEKRSFENNFWISLIVVRRNEEKELDFYMTRTTAQPKYLYGKLGEFIDNHYLDIKLIGLPTWRKNN